MNLFQLLTLSVVAAVLAAEFLGLCRKSAGRKSRLLRIAVWSAAAAAIVDPGIPQAVAIRIGIGRGADLVLYMVVLAFLWGSFYFYSGFVRLERQLTEVVRYVSIQNARRGRQEGEAWECGPAPTFHSTATD